MTHNVEKHAGSLIPEYHGSLEAAAEWGDTIKGGHEYDWASPLHYINTPDWQCGFDPRVDCPDDRCLVGALHNYTDRLLTPRMSFKEQGVALKFLLHFVGDIHQPMHVSFAADRGGNNEKGHFMGSHHLDSLHYIWDTSIINQRISRDFKGNHQLYTSYLLSKLPEFAKTGNYGNVTIGGTWAEDWAQETAKISCVSAYTDTTGAHIKNGFNLGEEYYQASFPVVEEQLLKGGIRLAALLEDIFIKYESTGTINRVIR